MWNIDNFINIYENILWVSLSQKNCLCNLIIIIFGYIENYFMLINIYI